MAKPEVLPAPRIAKRSSLLGELTSGGLGRSTRFEGEIPPVGQQEERMHEFAGRQADCLGQGRSQFRRWLVGLKK